MSKKKKAQDKVSEQQTTPPLPFENPGVVRALNIALYLTNFLLLHYVWEKVSPGDGNIIRLAACWFISYGLTRVVIAGTKVPLRAGLTVGFGALLAFVLLMPSG